ncbi:TPA: DNA polymerase III subunit alpha, partial [Candidatus Poribacteria bacterium]|nr:DNA polymerase III subunit alpha [Candidatus Poribacteria bacterium]HEX30268.1 DNA polymerase III subunit alpha [Candidatus Poribacteria bacterium]
GSLVSYAMGITEIDPVDNGLIFERFLNEERISLPDIDVDFCMEGREDVIRYVTEKYGRENVSHIITFSVMQARAAVRDVGRVLEMPYGEVDRIAKLIPPTPRIRIKDALEQEPRLRDLYREEPRVKELLDYAMEIEGLVRHFSTHAAGVVISDRPLSEYIPLCKDQKGDVLTQYEMNSLQAIGLIKFDLLSLRTLTLINRTLKMVEQTRGERIDIDRIPIDDRRTYELLSQGKTSGLFQLESRGMTDLIMRLKPERFQDLVALIALYRPGPLGSGKIDDYVRRRRGRTEVTYELPELERILQETYGIILYQEQVMKIANELAGFTMGEADRLRRAMGKKLPEEMEMMEEKFIEGARKKGINPRMAEKIFSEMSKFAEYGFNKSHSAAYAYVAYQTAYLKANYPIEFMASLLSLEMGNAENILRYIYECRSMGIEVLPPDVNESFRDFTVIGDQSIRFGLSAVKNVGDSAVEAIIEARERGGKFSSLFDFCERVDHRRVNKRVVESLIKCGAFDSIDPHRSRLMANLRDAIEYGSRRQRERGGGQIGLFELVEGPQELKEVAEWPQSLVLQYEKEALGFYLSGHPLAQYSDEIAKYSTVEADQLNEVADGQEVVMGGIVTRYKEVRTKKGEMMIQA